MRHALWERRLHDYLVAAEARPHDYGEHDCLLHCAAVVEAVTGEDLGAPHRGKYRSAAGAARYLRELGFDSPEEMLDSLFSEVPVGFAQRGDLVLTPPNDDAGWAIPGAAIGAVAICLATQGLVREPRSRWLKAWAVGRDVLAGAGA